jgi:hypothetical protein
MGQNWVKSSKTKLTENFLNFVNFDVKLPIEFANNNSESPEDPKRSQKYWTYQKILEFCRFVCKIVCWVWEKKNLI